jgi:hypothetical protein
VAPGTTTSVRAVEDRAGAILADLPAAEAALFRAEVAAVTAMASDGGDQR